MATIDEKSLKTLLAPYLGTSKVPGTLLPQLSAYLDLLLKWNSKTNLTAIREPEAIVRRHFGESLFLGLQLPAVGTLLDFGSGAGFPGLPIQLLRPDVEVTLAESQNKKASFLREAVRALGLTTEVWAARVEAMPAECRFDVVALRAVDNMDLATREATIRVRPGGTLAVLTSGVEGIPVPNSNAGIVRLTTC